MNTIASFFVTGEPKAQPRVKAYIRGSRAGVYTPGSANEWKERIRMEALKPDNAKLDQPGPYEVFLTFWLPRPKSHMNSKGLPKASAPKFPTGKPDVDNLAKAVMDVLKDTGVLVEDAQVVTLLVTKLYDEAVWKENAKKFCGVHISVTKKEWLKLELEPKGEQK